MNVSLNPELERLIHQKVESGLYNSASEVIREGLRLLIAQDELRDLQRQELRKKIQIGLDQAERGELLDGEEVIQELRCMLRDRGQ
jgi:antitoxin ParD1/3/4